MRYIFCKLNIGASRSGILIVSALIIFIGSSAFNACTDDVILGDGTSTTTTTTLPGTATTTTTTTLPRTATTTTTTLPTTATTTTTTTTLPTTTTTTIHYLMLSSLAKDATVMGSKSDAGSYGTGGWGREDKDSDRDGLSDDDENRYMTDPDNPDSDGDGYLDFYEISKGSDPLDVEDTPGGEHAILFSPSLDSDHDGLSDTVEDELGTDKYRPDTDADGVGDGAEFLSNTNILVPDSEQVIDSDGNGVSDEKERELGLNPNLSDSDRDGLNDIDELLIYGTNANNPDSDKDGLLDGRVVKQ